MNRKHFIQGAVIAFLPHLEWQADKALRYAEKLWQRLSEHGLGAEASTGPRPLDDHYRALSPAQKKGFDKFWKAFDLRRGKQAAAQRWGQLGDLPSDTYQHIIDAAKKEAERPIPQGQGRKMAQGWLSERRWEDHQAKTSPSEADRQQQQLQTLSGELAHARKMADMGDDWWASEATRIEGEISAMRAGNG